MPRNFSFSDGIVSILGVFRRPGCARDRSFDRSAGVRALGARTAFERVRAGRAATPKGSFTACGLPARRALGSGASTLGHSANGWRWEQCSGQPLPPGQNHASPEGIDAPSVPNQRHTDKAVLTWSWRSCVSWMSMRVRVLGEHVLPRESLGLLQNPGAVDARGEHDFEALDTLIADRVATGASRVTRRALFGHFEGA